MVMIARAPVEPARSGGSGLDRDAFGSEGFPRISLPATSAPNRRDTRLQDLGLKIDASQPPCQACWVTSGIYHYEHNADAPDTGHQ